jgi:hypothetical protein
MLVIQEHFRPNVYKVISHTEWAAANPGQCAEKIVFPWSSEKGDQLGVRLYNLSGSRITMAPHKLAALRKTGLNDDAIVNAFERFMQAEVDLRKRRGSEGKWRAVQYRFLRYLQGDLLDTELERLELAPFQNASTTTLLGPNIPGNSEASMTRRAQQSRSHGCETNDHP